MTNENVGEAIKKAFQFLGKVFEDTSKLLTVVEEYMKKTNFVSFYGAASVWDRSSAYYGSYGWLPHYLSRAYVPIEGTGQKPSSKGKLLAYVNIYFTPENAPQPVILYGTASLRSEDFDDSWSGLMLTQSGPNFVNSISQKSWTTYQCDEAPQIGLLHYKVAPLVEFEDQAKVEAMCTELVAKFLESKMQIGHP